MHLLFSILALSTLLVSCSNPELEREKIKLEKEKLKFEREKLELSKKNNPLNQSAKKPLNPTVSNTSNSGKISGNKVYLRSSYTTTSSAVTLLAYGQQVTILDQYSPEGNNNEAILREQTNFYDDYNGRFLFTLIKGKAVRVIDNDGYQCRISFKNDLTNSTGFTTIEESKLEFINGDLWYQIITPSGYKGWVLGKYIQKT